MNILEHFQVVDESFYQVYPGIVEDRDDKDTESGRVKVRVFGIFDIPISLEHIPWAYPISPFVRPPAKGDTVFVMFSEGDIYYPVYFRS